MPLRAHAYARGAVLTTKGAHMAKQTHHTSNNAVRSSMHTRSTNSANQCIYVVACTNVHGTTSYVAVLGYAGVQPTITNAAPVGNAYTQHTTIAAAVQYARAHSTLPVSTLYA